MNKAMRDYQGVPRHDGGAYNPDSIRNYFMPQNRLTRCLWLLKCWAGAGSVIDGSICWYSASETHDAHDYPLQKGGDGIPSHMHTYRCWRCGKPFEI